MKQTGAPHHVDHLQNSVLCPRGLCVRRSGLMQLTCAPHRVDHLPNTVWRPRALCVRRSRLMELTCAYRRVDQERAGPNKSSKTKRGNSPSLSLRFQCPNEKLLPADISSQAMAPMRSQYESFQTVLPKSQKPYLMPRLVSLPSSSLLPSRFQGPEPWLAVDQFLLAPLALLHPQRTEISNYHRMRLWTGKTSHPPAGTVSRYPIICVNKLTHIR